MILGPVETYNLLLKMGKPLFDPNPDAASVIQEKHALLPFPRPVSNQQRVLLDPPTLTDQDLKDMRALGLRSDKYAVIGASKRSRRFSSAMRCLLISQCLPANSILHVTGNVHILNPALCVLLLSRLNMLCDEEIVFAASQLCSRYAYSAEPIPELVERVPHTSAEHILAYVQQIRMLNEGRRMPNGIQRLERLLPYVVDGARSPREIVVAQLMKWKWQSGCLHVPPFEMNKKIELNMQERHELKKGHLESDFVWEREKVIIEYNGGVHAGQRDEDSARTNVLRDKGYTVEVLAASVLNNYESYLKFMRRLESKLDTSIPRSANAINRFRALHARIMEIASHADYLTV